MRKEVEIYALKWETEPSEQLYKRLSAELPEERRQRLARYHQRSDAWRSLFGDILARTVLSERLGVSPGALTIIVDAYGKPVLKNPEQLYFNVSHSGKWVVIAINDESVGVDVERMDPIAVEQIANRFFSEEERKALQSLSEVQRLNAFYRLWTMKESYVKALGLGLSVPLDSFTFSQQDGNIWVGDDSTLGYSCRTYELDSAYAMAACGRNANFPKCVHVADDEEWVNRFLFKIQNDTTG